jgi:hypothetical protein
MHDNPFAFPGQHWTRELGDVNHAGMELRDYFAGQALIGVINQSTIGGVAETIMAVAAANGVHEHDVMARAAYRYADALLAAREKGGA